MTAPVLSDLDVAHLLADAARAAILPHFRASGLLSENKLAEGFDPVTVADRAAEQAMRALLADTPHICVSWRTGCSGQKL